MNFQTPSSWFCFFPKGVVGVDGGKGEETYMENKSRDT